MDRTLKVKFYEWIRECGWGQVLSLDRIVGWVGRGVGKFSQLSNKKKLIWFIFYVYALIYPLVNWAIFFVFASLLFSIFTKKGDENIVWCSLPITVTQRVPLISRNCLPFRAAEFPPGFSGVFVAQTLVFCVNNFPFSICHCNVCPFIYGG